MTRYLGGARRTRRPLPTTQLGCVSPRTRASRSRGDLPALHPNANLGDYIVYAVLKELWAADLLELSSSEMAVGGGGAPYDSSVARKRLAQVAPNLAQDVLDAAGASMPIARSVSPVTLLPDLNEFAGAEEARSFTVLQRKNFVSALDIILSGISNSDEDQTQYSVQLSNGGDAITSDAEDEVTKGLPGSSVASIAAQIMGALEIIMMRKTTGAEAELVDPALQEQPWRHGAVEDEQLVEELIKKLQNSRAQLTNLENKMAAQARIHAAQLEWAKDKEARTMSRLMSANTTLEDKLRERRDENEQLMERLAEVEQRAEQERQLLEQRGKKMRRLEEDLAKATRMQDDIFCREQEYGHRVLRVRVEEFERLCQDHQRRKRLRKLLHADPGADVGDANDTEAEPKESDLALLARETLKSLTVEFDDFLAKREQLFEERVRTCEASLEEKRLRCESQHEEILEAHRLANMHRFKKRFRDAEVQADDHAARSRSPPPAMRSPSRRCSTRTSILTAPQSPGSGSIPPPGIASMPVPEGSQKRQKPRAGKAGKPGAGTLPHFYPKTLPLAWRASSPLQHSVLANDRLQRQLRSGRAHTPGSMSARTHREEHLTEDCLMDAGGDQACRADSDKQLAIVREDRSFGLSE